MQITLRKNVMDRESAIFVVPDTSDLKFALEMLWVEIGGPVDAPFFVKVNGAIWLRTTWDRSLPENAFVEVVAVVGGALPVMSVVLSIASIAFTAYLIAISPGAQNASTNTLPAADDVFSFSGQKNITKLNQPVEISFGRNKWFPSFYTLPRIYFDNNRAYLELFYSLGKGKVDVDSVFCGDTNVDDISNSIWEYKDKGYVISTHYDCIYVGDKTNVELAAPDAETFESIRTIVVPSGAYATDLQFNIAFPGGLYVSSPGFGAATVQIRYKYRAVDEQGKATTPWSAWIAQSFTGTTTTPQRRTIVVKTGIPARYEVQIERVSVANSNGANRCNLIAAYGLGNSGKATSVQTLYVKLQGSNSIDENSASDVSVVTSRYLITPASGTIANFIKTRNPIHAIVSLLMDAGIPMQDLDAHYWEDLANRTTGSFDYVYTNKTTVWEALQDICKTFRAEMFVAGSDFRVSINSPDAIPVGFFGPDNAKNLDWNILFPQINDYDAIEAVYVDPITGLQVSVQFTPPGSQGINPRSVTFAGVTDRTQAWRLAAYTWLSTSLQRDTVSFTAGMDGMIPMYGDLITVAWPFPAWAQAGLVQYQDDNGDLVVTEDLDADGGPNWLSLRTTSGAMWGPVACTLNGANRIVPTEPLPNNLFEFEDFTREAVMFTFGKSTTMEKVFRVTSLTPGEADVKIEAVVFDTAVFTYDTMSAPANDRLPVSTPGISWIQITRASSGFYKIFWPAVKGATGYTVKYIVFPDNAISDPYIKDPATITTWDSAPTLSVFNTSAYLATQTNSRIVVQISWVGITSGMAYWRGLSNGNPLVLTLGTGFTANAINGNNGSVTFDAANIDMLYKVDHPIDGETTLTYQIYSNGGLIASTSVPVESTGLALFSGEIMRRSGLAGVYGDTRTIGVDKNGTTLFDADLVVNPISIPVGMDNYVEVGSYADRQYFVFPSNSLEDQFRNVPYIRRYAVTLIAGTTGELCTELEYAETTGQFTNRSIVKTSDSRNSHIDVWKTTIAKVKDKVIDGSDVKVNFEHNANVRTQNVVLIDGNGDQILTDGDYPFRCIDLATGYLPNVKLTRGYGMGSLSSAEQSRVLTTAIVVYYEDYLINHTPPNVYKTVVKARLKDYYGTYSDFTEQVELAFTP